MANLFGDEPPRWLQEIAKPIDAKATGQFMGLLLAGAQNADNANERGEKIGFIEGYQQARQNLADPNWKLKQEQAKATTLATIARSATAIGSLQLQQQEQRAWLEDLPKIQAWAALPAEEQVQKPLSDVTSKRGVAMAGQLNRNASSGVLAKSMMSSKADYDKRVSKLVDEDKTLGVGLALPPGKFPGPEEWRALTETEARHQLRKDLAVEDVRAEAREKDLRETITIDKKGDIGRKFEEGRDYKPKSMDIGGGQVLWYNPATGSFKIQKANGESKDMTYPQLQALWKANKNSADPGLKAQADYIKKFLMETAIEQIRDDYAEDAAEKPKGAAAAPPPARGTNAPAATPSTNAPAATNAAPGKQAKAEAKDFYSQYLNWKTNSPGAVPR